MTGLTVRVVDRRDVAEGVFALKLAALDDSALPRWSPGAHIDVAAGAAGVRQYSLCGDPADEYHWRIAILHEAAGRGGSDHLHRTALPNTELRVSLPRNNFELSAAEKYLFIAGGIGITAILPMVAAAERAGASWRLYYGARTRAHLSFTDELARYPQVDMVAQDESGLLPVADLLAGTTAPVYCCGPEPLLLAVETEAARRGLVVRTERFVPRSVDTGEDRPFELRLPRSGRTLHVPADRSIVDVLESAGVAIMTSCREGTCGSCETGVLKGEVEHRDSVLTAEERRRGTTFMPCVSRAISNVLVLDL
ncbi:PDR/VanB family oxidoreductase [Nocardia africana]|uniref:Phthalate dioxygenase reductase n=1 Tax=Nocardia africana TaxID=134964 RepID=A0A378WVT8_9NOCA|nr:PDR/VanB family oxidoreductase [Nocardia africana]MCC3313880.1 PDR/VanB family oxidoreductase [Nocardia africana]SUA44735.1 Phthalate dioxygenase reductase [Nocardia africana]